MPMRFSGRTKKTVWVIQKQASRATCHPFLVKKPSDTKKAGKKLLKHGYLKKIGNDILITIDIGAMYPSSESVKLIPHGSRVTIEHRFYSP